MPYFLNPLSGNFDFYKNGTGAPGPAGPAGPAGPTGPAGADSTVPGPTGAAGATGATGAAGVGVPAGGTALQVLRKIDGTDYNTEWATPSGGSGSPGGSTTQVQYNNAGAFAGAANVEIKSDNLQLTEPSTAPGAADTSSLLVYPTSMASRFMPAMRGPIGPECLIQPSIFSNAVMMFSPQSGTVGTGSAAFQTAWTSAGSVNHGTPSTANLASSQRRTQYFNVITTLNQQCGPRMNDASNMPYFRGNAANIGGFFFFTRFALPTLPASGWRVFAGLQGVSATNSVCVADTDPINTCGLRHITSNPNTGSGALNFYTGNGTVGTSQPITITLSTTAIYDFMMYAPANTSSIFFRLIDREAGVSYTHEATATLPVNTVGMSPQVQVSNGTNTPATAIVLGLAKIYCESEF